MIHTTANNVHLIYFCARFKISVSSAPRRTKFCLHIGFSRPKLCAILYRYACCTFIQRPFNRDKTAAVLLKNS